MALALLRQIRHALSTLNPSDLREEAGRQVRVGLVAPSAEALGRMETYFAPPHLSPERRAEVVRMLVRDGGAGCDLEIYDSALLRPKHAFAFDPQNPDDTVNKILKSRPELMLALARHFFPFRKPAAMILIRRVAKENAVFSLTTALPDIVPLLSLPWAVGEFASDTAFLTMNQIRLAFMLAAISDRPIGYREQRSEVGTIIASAFGWRAIARELVAKIPFGGGLVPKAAVAWAATYALGLSFERLYRLGYGLTKEERLGVYEEAYQHGKQISGFLLNSFRKKSKPGVVKAG